MANNNNIKNFASSATPNTVTTPDIGNYGRGFVVFAEGSALRVMSGDTDVDNTSTPPVGINIPADSSAFFDRHQESANKVTVASAVASVNYTVQVVL